MTDAGHGYQGCFATLGIAPTGEVRAIKRAYAGILKTIDLAAEPDRFARLRAAYETALREVPYIEDEPGEPALALPPEPTPDADAIPAPAPATVRWNLRGTAPRHRLRNTTDPRADIDNATGSRDAPPAARMPPVLAPYRSGRPSAAPSDDDGEADAIAALLDDRTPDRPRLLDAAMRRFGWDMVGTDMGGFGPYESWFARLIEERARWDAIAPRQRRKPDKLLARIAAGPPDGSIADLYRWRRFAETREAFPLWTAFVAGNHRLEEWDTAAVQAPALKRWAARAPERPFRHLFIAYLLVNLISIPLHGMMRTSTLAFGFVILFSIVQTTIVILFAVSVGLAVGRRLRRKP
ncbi:hypothetical protein ACFSGX_03035 [Sphingomonas arantia]|uniref:J domain-containing protein n=1 Tax=Sphingomonas arantia TaxID=1460676 RepID=A0ABW4TSU1_9SPHN